MGLKVYAYVIPWCLATMVFSYPWESENRNYLQDASGPTAAILDATYDYDCSLIYVVDSKLTAYATAFIKEVDEMASAPRGTTVIELEIDENKPNISMSEITPAMQETSWLRRRSWCVIVVILSNDPAFLEIVGQVGKMERLSGWSSKLLVVTEIHYSHLERIISNHWTYCMMNTMFVNAHREEDLLRWTVYAFFLYSPSGPQVIELAAYTHRLHVYKTYSLFPDKYKNFHGGVVNVTSLEHTPHFMSRVEIKEDGTEETIIFGSDGMLLHAMEDTLNFTSYLMPAKTWEEVLQLVVDRTAFISPVYWELVPDHLVTHDMTVVYEIAYFAFSMAATPPKPHWSGLFQPLTIDTWIGILINSIVAILALGMILYVTDKKRVSSKFHAVAEASFDISSTLLEQNFNYLLPTSATGRILILTWLIFTFIMGSAYKANLKAFLMKPTDPVRAETVEELVQAVDRVTGESYLYSTKIFFLESDYLPYNKLGKFMEIGFETSEGMQIAAENKRSAHTDFLKHMQHVLVEKFTKPDGTTSLYIGKTKIVHFPSCMPVPHDLPFLPHMDHIIMQVVESGLMDKWFKDEIEIARRKSIKQQRDYRQKLLENNEVVAEDSSSGGGAGNLTLAHLQVAFMLFAAGIALSFLAFLFEIRGKIVC